MQELLLLKKLLYIYFMWIISFEKFDWSLFHLWLIFFWFDNQFIPVKRLSLKLFSLNIKIFLSYFIDFLFFVLKTSKLYLIKLFFHKFVYRPFFFLCSYFFFFCDFFFTIFYKFNDLFIVLPGFLLTFIRCFFVYPIFFCYTLIYSSIYIYTIKYRCFLNIYLDNIILTFVLSLVNLNLTFKFLLNKLKTDLRVFFSTKFHKVLFFFFLFFLLFFLFFGYIICKHFLLYIIKKVLLLMSFFTIIVICYIDNKFGYNFSYLSKKNFKKYLLMCCNVFKPFIFFCNLLITRFISFIYFSSLFFFSPMIVIFKFILYEINLFLYFRSFFRCVRLFIRKFIRYLRRFIWILLVWLLGSFCYFFLMCFYYLLGAVPMPFMRSIYYEVLPKHGMIALDVFMLKYSIPNFFILYWHLYEECIIGSIQYFLDPFWKFYLKGNDLFWCNIDVYIFNKIETWFVFFFMLYYYREFIKYWPHGIMAWLKKKKLASRRMSYYHIHLPNLTSGIVLKFLFFMIAPWLTLARKGVVFYAWDPFFYWDGKYWECVEVSVWTYYWFIQIWILPLLAIYGYMAFNEYYQLTTVLFKLPCVRCMRFLISHWHRFWLWYRESKFLQKWNKRCIRIALKFKFVFRRILKMKNFLVWVFNFKKKKKRSIHIKPIYKKNTQIKPKIGTFELFAAKTSKFNLALERIVKRHYNNLFIKLCSDKRHEACKHLSVVYYRIKNMAITNLGLKKK